MDYYWIIRRNSKGKLESLGIAERDWQTAQEEFDIIEAYKGTYQQMNGLAILRDVNLPAELAMEMKQNILREMEKIL